MMADVVVSEGGTKPIHFDVPIELQRETLVHDYPKGFVSPKPVFHDYPVLGNLPIIFDISSRGHPVPWTFYTNLGHWKKIFDPDVPFAEESC
jgi:hypothetical protein